MADVAWVVGLTEIAARRYERGVAWLQVGLESDPTRQPSELAQGLLSAWAWTKKPLLELQRLGRIQLSRPPTA